MFFHRLIEHDRERSGNAFLKIPPGIQKAYAVLPAKNSWQFLRNSCLVRDFFVLRGLTESGQVETD